MIKNWILKLDFVRKAINQASVDGTDWGKSQSDANWQQAFDEQVEMKSKKALTDLLMPFDERLIITYDKKTGLIFVGGKRLEEPTIMNLKAESEFFKNSQLWKIINESLKSQAQKTMFENSTTFEDMMTGKMMLYDLSFQNKILDIFIGYTQKPKPYGVDKIKV